MHYGDEKFGAKNKMPVLCRSVPCRKPSCLLSAKPLTLKEYQRKHASLTPRKCYYSNPSHREQSQLILMLVLVSSLSRCFPVDSVLDPGLFFQLFPLAWP